MSLVDRLREEQKERAATEGWGAHCIGVHCHYGKFHLGPDLTYSQLNPDWFSLVKILLNILKEKSTNRPPS
jgi:hypothetical protein